MTHKIFSLILTYSQKALIRRVNLWQLLDIAGGDNSNHDFLREHLFWLFLHPITPTHVGTRGIFQGCVYLVKPDPFNILYRFLQDHTSFI